MNSWNIVLKARNGRRLNLGKIVLYQGRPVYHYWADPDERRQDIDAWGFREAILAHCDRHGVRDVFVYDKKNKLTYCTTLEKIAFLGTRGKTDLFGRTLNLPKDVCTTRPKLKVDFIPEEVYRIVSADDVWLSSDTDDSSASPEKSDHPTQLGFLGEEDDD